MKTELVQSRAFPTRFACKLALVEYFGWFNHTRLHENLGDVPPAEFEALCAPRSRRSHPNLDQGVHLADPPHVLVPNSVAARRTAEAVPRGVSVATVEEATEFEAEIVIPVPL